MRQSRRVWLLLVVLLIASATCYAAVEWWQQSFPPKLYELISKLFLTGSIIVFVHLLDLLFLKRETQHEIVEIVSKQMTLSDAATKRGLKHVYASREDAHTDILDNILEATKQIWIIAVVQKEHPNLEKLLDQLNKKLPHCTIRILLLDGCSPAAVIRTIMESPAGAAKSILDYHYTSTDETKKSGSDPYRNEAVFRYFEQNCRAISNHPTDLQQCIKFYDHTPLCSLIIADNTAFYQPYTFGSHGSDDRVERLTGMNMPIFRFEAYRNSEVIDHQDTFSILVSHAKRLWDTSDIEYKHRSDETDRNERIKLAFEQVKDRIRIVYDAIHENQKAGPRKRALSRTAKRK